MFLLLIVSIVLKITSLKTFTFFTKFFIRFIHFIFFVSVLFACVSKDHMRPWCPPRSEEGIGCLETGQQVLLTLTSTAFWDRDSYTSNCLWTLYFLSCLYFLSAGVISVPQFSALCFAFICVWCVQLSACLYVCAHVWPWCQVSSGITLLHVIYLLVDWGRTFHWNWNLQISG